MLKERGAAEVVPKLASWVEAARSARTPSTSTIAWKPSGPYQALDVAEPGLLEALLHSQRRHESGPRPRGSSRSGRRGWPIRGRSWPSA